MSEIILIVVVAGAVASIADRAVFARGRRFGLREAADEIMRGVAQHYQHDKTILNALNNIKVRFAEKRPSYTVSAGLLELGRAVGDVAFGKGFEAGRDFEARLEAPVSGKIRVDLSISELMQIRWLAHFGFEHTMWNTWDPEGTKPRPHADIVFKTEPDAQRATEAIDTLERSIPKGERDPNEPYALAINRQQMIREQWPSESEDVQAASKL